jgi:hypothetical protein
MTCALTLLLIESTGHAQVITDRSGKVDYYRSPFGWGLQVDPLGYVLGRIGGRLEMRSDPNFSYYLDYAFDRDTDSLKTTITSNAIPTHSAGVGVRIYLRDNQAIEGLFGGVAIAGTIQSGSKLGARLSAEIGYKWMLSEYGFFIEPQLIIDAYPFRLSHGKPFFTYIALPIGFAWR